MSGLLQDKIFISTRPEGQSDELAQLFTEAGATLLEMPLIKIQPIRLTEKEAKCIQNLVNFDWLIFTSPNGVTCFFDNLIEISGNHNLPESVQMAVIGNKTEKVLISYGHTASFKNPGSTGEDFAEAFIQQLKNTNHKPKILLALGNLARTVIQDKLNEFADCTRINLYETNPAGNPDEKLLSLILNDKYEMILFTSPSGLNGFLNLSGNLQPEKLRIACIGETTSKTAIENNITPKVVAEKSSAAGLFESIVNYYKNNKN